MAMQLNRHLGLLFLIFYFVGFLSFPVEAALKKYQFDIRVKNVRKLCHSKPIVTVNGREEHAQILWLRATVYGAIVILPKEGTPFLFPRPHRSTKIILEEWSNSDVETIVNQANRLEVPPPTSDAHTINGRPGSLFPCSQKDTFTMEVESGKTYLLRIINAALNDQVFFTITGQTTNVLVKADQAPGWYFMAARPFMDAPVPWITRQSQPFYSTRECPTQF
ncbi:hypothetical protein SLEP1_g17616 [Rubroshorea leprosula]|uniref:laccase n=1 Tax=Rubroshorea leprosula TaxID=152421 RepID=A0AAV5J0E5_9ROSI|nr:hypothetical protein SLEP1_g17616 [Rubroshorea leprosula]